MRFISFLLMLTGAAVVQTLMPPWWLMGQAKVPVLLALCLYYALRDSRRLAIQAAVLAGLVQDAMSMIPLGYSSLAFAVVCLLAIRFRDLIFIQEGLTHVLLGAVGAALVTVLLSVFLIQSGVVLISAGWLFLKISGSLLLGAVTVPLAFMAFSSLDNRLGIEREHYA